MKLLKTSALALCLVFLFTPLLSKAQTLDPTQVYTTGNIVQDTPQGGPTPWVGGVYQDQLTCWGWGDPGYCGPSPIVRPGGHINFSYGSSYIYQQQHISTLLPSLTGLQVNGYNFGFTAKNGNGWDDGRTDNLMALVRFWDNTGGRGADNLLYGNVYSLNYKFNWTTFNYSETFTKPLAVPSIGQVQYGFIGSDNNGWAGPYGPEIYNVNFSLKYSVDPCVTNVLSSPSCPGYLDAIAKLTPQPTMTGVTTETTYAGTTTLVDSVLISPTGTYGSLLPPPDTTQPSPTQQSSPLPPGPAMPGPTQQASTTQPSSTQTRIGEVSDSGGGSKSTVSLSSVLSMIGSNQEKTAALEKSVVQAADAQAFSAGESAKQQAEKLAADVQSQSIANSGGSQSGSMAASATQSFGMQTQGSTISLPGNLQSSAAANSTRLQQSINSSNMISQTETTPSFNTTAQQQYDIQSSSRQEFNVAMVTPQVSYSLFAPTRYTPQVQIEPPTTDGIKFGYRGPLENAMDARPVMPQASNNSQQTDSVKKNVANNEAAGDVKVEDLSKQGANLALYMALKMQDVAFYAPKEVYRNQRVVDNARLLRSLSGGSDALHQRMVDQQYK
jgi:hypothetical protein